MGRSPLGLVAATAVLLAAAGATAEPTVFVSPGTTLVAPGESFTMDVRVDGGTDTVTCFLVEFEFDPAVIQLVSANEGSLFAACGFPTMCNWDVLDLGHHSWNDVILGPYAFTVAPGELVSLEFVAGQVGSTPVEILTVDLRDYRRDRILPVWTRDATVSVASASGVGDGDGGPRRLSATASPNPFGGTVEVEVLCADIATGRAAGDGEGCSLPRSAPLAAVYDAAGRLVTTLTPRQADGGWTACWDGRGRPGFGCAAGVYFVVYEWPGCSVTKPVVLVR